MLPLVEFRDAELLLRPPQLSDAEAIASSCADPEIPRFIPWIPSPYSSRDADLFIERASAAWRESRERTFVVVDADRDELLGLVSIRLGEGGTAGYWVKKEARGRGVAARSLRRVVEWAEQEGVRHLCLTTHPANVASQCVAEKAGFIRRGFTKHEPAFQDGTTDAILFERRSSR